MRSTGALCLLLVVGATCLIKSTDAHPSSASKYEHYSRRYYSNPNNCAHCLPGWGLVAICNSKNATVCTPCDEDTWSPHRPHLTQCRPCSKCGEGLYEEHKCRPNHDTRCGWCHASKGVFTEDFIRKCGSIDDAATDDDQESPAIGKLQEEEKRNEKNVGVPDDGDRQHEFWDFKKSGGPLDITDEQRIVIKPSYHEYNISERLRMAAYRQKFYVLLGCGGVLMLIAFVFLIWLMRECRRPMHRIIPGRQRLYVHLTEQDNEIIRQCAYNLRREGKLRSLSDCDMPANNDDEYWEEPMRITDNPLEHFMAVGSTERLVPKAKC